ncbi:MAG: alkaline phosphatase family protein [Acidobacteriota bacterium]|nr:alkaline phosphatase family protein [Acidobacteriota bacterium]
MKRLIAGLLLIGYLPGAVAQTAAPAKPRLIVTIVVDQFRYDYLLRFRSSYTAGFKRLLEHGAVFDDAHHTAFPTVTAVGHSTLLSGAPPAMSGIVGNEWYDRESKQTVTSVSDPATRLVGGIPGTEHMPGASPRRMLVSTLGDEIKMQGRKAKVIGISIKDRGAILPAGHMADAAYWFDPDCYRWITSTYYMDRLPDWAEEINRASPPGRALGASWFALDAKPNDPPLCSMVAGKDDVPYCGSLEASPWGNEIIEEFAERAVVAEEMGQHEGTDVLSVSFSANDYVGHAAGPDAPAVRDISIRTDLLLGKFMDLVDSRVGAANVVYVLTADHGVAPVPEVNQARKMPGGRLSDMTLGVTIQQALEKKYGPGKWVAGWAGSTPYLNRGLMEKYRLNEADVERTAAEAVRALPHIFRVYTAQQLSAGPLPDDAVSVAVRNGFFPRRSGDLLIIPEGFYLYDATGTSHGTPFNYDTHVPLIFMGKGIRAGHYYGKASVTDVAPTLAAIVGVQEPSGSVGRVLNDIWQ